MECDFDQPIPLPDNSIDIAVILHVIEHLPRPSFTLNELWRVLKPSGLLIAGTPVVPRAIAPLLTWRYKRLIQKGRKKKGHHIQILSCSRWKHLCHESLFDIEVLTGTYFMSNSKSRLENSAFWLRLNHLWGGLVPSLGSEINVIARKRLPPFQ